MKKALRSIPIYQPKKPGFWGLITALTLTVIGWVVLSDPIVTVLYSGMIALLIVWNKFEITPNYNEYFHSLMEQRKGVSVCDFSREFNGQEVDTWLVHTIYELVQQLISTEHRVPILATDHLFYDLLLEDDDLDLAFAKQVSLRTNRCLVNYKSNPYFGKVTTVRNLVLFFAHQPSSTTTQ